MNTFLTTPKAQGTISSLWKLEKVILDTLDFKEVVQKIVDSVLTELGYLNLGYCIIVLTLIDEEKQILRRISISKTEQAQKALEASPIPFEKIEIPLTESNNLLIRTLNSKVPWVTNNLSNVLCPPLNPKDVDPVQMALGIKSISVYPVSSRGRIIGTLIFSLLKSSEEVSEEEKDLLAGFTDVVGLAVQNARLYSSLNEATEKLKEVNERLKEVDKLKDEFVSLASHELRTPMTVIKSYLWLMLDKNNVGALSEKQKMYIDRAYTSTQRLINLVNDMLNVSRIESGRFTLAMKPIDLGDLINTVYAEMLPKAQEQKVNLEFAKPLQPLSKVQADSERIEQVLINIIGNSLKFTPEDGSIRISIDYDPKTQQEIVSIADNGKGISAEDIPKLFQKFSMVGTNYLIKQNTQGTGLGLYLSKSIIELMGGKIWVESGGLGKGSKFSFTLKTV